MNSVTSMKLKSTNINKESPTISNSKNWDDCLRNTLVLHHTHIHPSDWNAIDPNRNNQKFLSKWKKVPAEDMKHYENMLKDEGRSYAYVSLLHLCRRQNIEYIHFNEHAPKINNLAAFDDEWSKHITKNY